MGTSERKPYGDPYPSATSAILFTIMAPLAPRVPQVPYKIGHFALAMQEYWSLHPVARAPYRLALSEMKELSEQLQELSDKGFIRPSSSPWEPRSCLSKKKERVHFRCALTTCEINKLTVKNRYPLSRGSTICLNQLQGSRYLSKIRSEIRISPA
ncbi:hypothetical protein Tco_0754995 [Tanacetum coccineum]